MLRVGTRLAFIVLAAIAAGCSTGRASKVTTEDRPPAPTAQPDAGEAPPAPLALGGDAGAAEPPAYEPDPKGEPTVILRPDATNMKYARLDRRACEAELRRRAIPFVNAVPTAGVMTPVWLRGPLRGVSIHSALPAKRRARASFEIFDCRLVLALDDFAALVAAHDVVEIVHMSAFRARKDRGCTPKYLGKQHCAALAVDIGSFRRRDGSVLVVERDFKGRIGVPTCGPTAPRPLDHASEELRAFVCDAAQKALFNVILTPNYNWDHRNHMHLEITPDAGWMLIH